MSHSQKFVETVEEIYKLAAQIPDPKKRCIDCKHSSRAEKEIYSFA